jgi:PfaD family protein
VVVTVESDRLADVGNVIGRESHVDAAPISPPQLEALIEALELPLLIIEDEQRRRHVVSGSLRAAEVKRVVGHVPPLPVACFGAPSFRAAHSVRYAYVAGEMGYGVASEAMVVALAHAKILGFFGAAGLKRERIEQAIATIQSQLPAEAAFGMALPHEVTEPEFVSALLALYLRTNVRRISLSASTPIQAPLVRFRLSGLGETPNGAIVTPNHLFVKVTSEAEAASFMSPAPDALLEQLRQEGVLTPRQVELARRVPLAEDVTVEGDAGPYAERQPLSVLLPLVAQARQVARARCGDGAEIRIGAAGGLGTPEAIASAFALGADYVLTGSVNQASVEANTSESVKQLLAKAVSPASVWLDDERAELFGHGPLLKHGTLFAARSRRLLELSNNVASVESLSARDRSFVEEKCFRQPLEAALAAARAHFTTANGAASVANERDNPLRLLLRWYGELAADWARSGSSERQADFRVWCGPAMAAFNSWVHGSFLESVAARRVVEITENLLQGAAAVTRFRSLVQQGALARPTYTFTPRPLSGARSELSERSSLAPTRTAVPDASRFKLWDPARREPTDLADCLEDRAERLEHKIAFRFWTAKPAERETITYGELHRRASALAAHLQSDYPPGTRVMLLYPPSVDFIVAFFACVYARHIAIPMSPPHPAQVQRAMPRLRAILEDARPSLVLGAGSAFTQFSRLEQELAGSWPLRFMSSDGLDSRAHREWKRPPIAESDPAFLQYTSGSTSSPRGVVLSHANLMSNLALIGRTLAGPIADVRGVFWLPLYHDMGLIGGVLGNVYREGTTTLMSPLEFLKRPLNWLTAISETQANISGAPDFGFLLAVERTTEAERAALDLSSWEVAFSGAERIRPETMRRFAEAFQVSGFRKDALHGSYGLAEATLLVSCGRIAGPASEKGLDTGAVSSGRIAPRTRVVIVDPVSGLPCDDGKSGEIWVQGPGIASGYWQRREESDLTFGATLPLETGTFLRTGDLGFRVDDELVVTGRLKDLIIINGKNHIPEDIEATVNRSHPFIRAGECAAFAVDGEREERLILLAELDRAASTKPGADAEAAIAELREEVKRAIQTSVSEHHSLAVHDIILLRRGRLPKTSSGKLQRYLCRQRYVSGALAQDAI